MRGTGDESRQSATRPKRQPAVSDLPPRVFYTLWAYFIAFCFSASAADRRFFERVLVRKEVARDAAEGAGRVAAAAEGEERLLIGDARLLERLARLRAADSLAACRSSSQHSIEHRRVDAAGVASSTVKVARASCCAMISGWVS